MLTNTNKIKTEKQVLFVLKDGINIFGMIKLDKNLRTSDGLKKAHEEKFFTVRVFDIFMNFRAFSEFQRDDIVVIPAESVLFMKIYD